jgi:hypothetical protein
MIGTNLSMFLALVEFEGRLFNYLDNWTGVSCIEEGMRKGKKNEGQMSSRANISFERCSSFVIILFPTT